MPLKISFRFLLSALVAVYIAACAPVPPSEPLATAEPSTSTPEIFNPLRPSPTPSDSTLPPTCQVTDLNVYLSEEWGYCFAYPKEFILDESRAAENVISIYGPPLDNNTDPLRVSLEITTQVVPDVGELAPLVDAYLASFHQMAGRILREPATLGGEPAEKLEPVPGLLSSRILMSLHENILFTLRFHPSDIMITRMELNDLTQTVTGSFTFLPASAAPASQKRTVSWYEFGQNISLSYDASLAPWVDAWTVDAVPVSDQVLFSESHPAFAQIRFLGFQAGRSYQLPLLPPDTSLAQVMVFQTSDFSGFGRDTPQGFDNQLQALSSMLERGIEPERCAQPITGEPAMPFLPWVNAKQTLCAQPELIEFSGGKGVRYLTYYSQDPSPVLDQLVFYTFQGLTEDQEFYVAAFFPVQTGIFPTEPPACPQCGEPAYDLIAEWTTVLTEQLDQLNAQSEEDFAPSLTLLDEVIRSIHVGN